MKTYKYLYSIEAKNNNILKILILVITSILASLCLINGYDNYDTLGIYDGKYLVLKIQKDNSDIIKNNNYIKINNQKESYQIQSVSSLKVEDYINYKDVIIKTNSSFEENEIVNITFYYNKEKLIKKIIKLIF